MGLRVPIQGLWRHVLMPVLRLVAPLCSCLCSSSALAWALAWALPRLSLLRRAMDIFDLCPFAAAFSTRRARWLRVPIQGLWRHVLMPLLRLVAPLGSCLGSSSALLRFLPLLFLGSPSFGERWT